MGAKIFPGTPCMVNKRNERDQNDDGRVDDRLRALRHAFHNQVGRVLHFNPAGEFSIHVLQHHDRRIHQNSKIDGADGNQIGRVTRHHHQRQRKQNSERNRQHRQQGRAEIPDRHDQHQRHQRQAGQNDVLHRIRGDVDQFRAVVERLDLHARRQQVAVVQVRNFLLQRTQRGQGLLILLQQYDPLHHVAVVVASHTTHRRLKALAHRSNIAHQDGNIIPLCHHDRFDILNGFQQANGAHVHVLRAQARDSLRLHWRCCSG